jgi:hypothetical protein
MDEIIISLYIMSEWIKHVKQFQAQHGCSYKNALKGASSSYRSMKGSGQFPRRSDTGQMYATGVMGLSKQDMGVPSTKAQGGNLKRTSKAQLKRIVAALGDKAVGKLSGMGAVGDMLKQTAANTTAQLITSGGDRASSEMTTRGTGVNRLKKAGRWESFSNAALRDAIDTAGKAGRVYYDTTSPMSKMGFGLKKHRKLKGKALLAAGY